MANSVDLVIGQEAIKQVESLISKLSLADAELLKISQSAMGASKGISGISTPSGLDKAVTNTAALNAQLEKQNAIINKLHADIAKKAEQSRLAEIRLQQAREKAFDSYERNAQKESVLAEKNANAYNKTQSQINNLTKAYNDLAVRKERYNNLSVNEEMRLKTLSAVNEKYNGILKATDATIGKNQRNVGNYASGYNALGNSINQLTREAPAFANSVGTGFMAISNNIPALFDAINGIRDKNKMLVAEGKPTVSVLKSIAGAIFSWQTLLSVGVTLLTLYGGKIVEWAGALMRGKEATHSLAENQKTLNDSLKESSGSYAQEKVNIDVLYKSATDLSRSYKDRKRDVDELQQLYPFYFKNLSDEAIMTGKAKDQYNLLSQAIITTAKARASEEILQKRESERLTIEQDDITKITKKYGELNKAKLEKTTSASIGVGGVSTLIGKETIRREIQQLRDDSIKQREIWAKEDAFFIKKIAEGNAIEQTLKPDEKAKKAKVNTKEIKAEEDRLKAIAEFRKSELELELAVIDAKLNNEDLYYSDRLTALDADFIKRVEISKLDYDEEFRLSKGNQDKQKTALNDFQIEKLKLLEDYNKKKNELEKLDLNPVTTLATSKNQAKDPFQSVIDSAKNAVKGLKPHTDELKTNWEDTFNEIAEASQKAGAIMAEFSQMNFQNEYARLESQKDIALKFAGDGTAAKEKIEADYEKKRKEIANRENKAKQKQAIFNIAIDTAQAIMAIWAHAKDPTGISQGLMTGIIGALGAAQIAMVASQKIPKYFEGTDNHIGGMMLVNDGAGSNFQEKVILPNGKEIIPEGRNVLMNAPKGTKVLTHEQQIMQMLNERGVSMSAKYSQNNGMTANEMDGIMSKHFSKIQTNVTTFDRNGMRSWTEKNGNRTIQNNNRVSGNGFKV